MRRAIFVLGGTVAGVAALLSFKTHSAADVSAAAGTGSAASPPASASAPATSAPATSAPAAGQADGGAGAGSMTTRTVTGKVADTPEGPVQVQLVLTGERISRVNVLKRTDNGEMSNQVNSFAIPRLTSETLTAQSARIDAVSGATYTSQGYIQSLQSAVDAIRA